MIDDFRVIKGDVDAAINVMKEVARWGRSVGLNVWKDEYLIYQGLGNNT